MNNNTAISTYLSTAESKNQNKQISRIETDSQIQNIVMVARWEKDGGMGEKSKGIKKYKLVVTEQSQGCEV